VSSRLRKKTGGLIHRRKSDAGGVVPVQCRPRSRPARTAGGRPGHQTGPGCPGGRSRRPPNHGSQRLPACRPSHCRCRPGSESDTGSLSPSERSLRDPGPGRESRVGRRRSPGPGPFALVEAEKISKKPGSCRFLYLLLLPNPFPPFLLHLLPDAPLCPDALPFSLSHERCWPSLFFVINCCCCWLI
jgi:hypothetical protein